MSSFLVLIVIVVTFSVLVIFTLSFETSLSPYCLRKSAGSIVTLLSSLAVTVKVTVFPSSTSFLAGEIVTVGRCVSGASVGITGSLLSEVTFPLLLVTTVSAVIGFPGRASLTVTFAIPPLVFPVPISLVPS